MLDLYQRASELKKQGEYNKSEELFKKIIIRSDEKLRISGSHFHIAEMAYNNHHHIKSKKHFVKCLELNPNHLKANEYMNKFSLKKKEKLFLKLLEDINIMPLFLNNKLKHILSEKGYHLLKKHYYLPIPQYEDMPRESYEKLSEMAGVKINDKKIIEFMENELLYMEEFRNNFTISKNGNNSFYLINGSFMAVDAHIYYNIIRANKPKKIIEIGGGNSSILAQFALEKNYKNENIKSELDIIEPYPRKALIENISKSNKIITQKVQSIPLENFMELEKNDILFIDSSHVLRANGDVQYEFLEIIPRLKSGVFVHIHDISLPKAYPKVYYDTELFYNEQYLLQAFLAFNSNVEVIWPGNYMMINYPEKMHKIFPEIKNMRKKYPNSEPVSFWFKIK